MRHQTCFVLLLAFVFNCISVGAVPSFGLGDLKFGSDQKIDNDYERVNSKIYNILANDVTTRGKCVKHVTATGNGVGDTFDLPCSTSGVFTITSDKILVYGNPEQDPFSLVSYSPSILNVIADGKCMERTYKTVTRKTFSETAELSEEDCKRIRDKIHFIIDQESKILDVLDKHFKLAQSSPKKPFQASFKALSEGSPSQLQEDSKSADNSRKPQTMNHHKSAHKGITVTEQTNHNKPSPMYQPANSADDLNPVSVSHQQTPHNGITVTELAASQQPNSHNGITVTEVSSSSNKDPSPVAESDNANHGESTGSLFNRLGISLGKLRKQVSNHLMVHHSSDKGVDVNGH